MTNFFSELEQNIFDPALPAGTLQSIQSIITFDLLGSGEINGFPSAIAANATLGTESYLKAALKDVFLNGTQILKQSADLANPKADDFNFPGITFEIRTGTSSQQAIKNNLLISQAQIETAVGVEVTKASAVTRSITSACDQLRVTMAFPSLQEFKDDGTVTGAGVRILMKITENDGTQHDQIINDLIEGKATSTYKRDYGISVTGMNFPITLEVSRFNEDSNSSKLQNKSIFDSFTAITADTNAYLNSAYTALRIRADSFGGSIPKRMFRVQGTKIKIPHNATVQADGSLSYSGTFNGTFKTDKAFTNDPAWILYDVLTTDKALGNHLDSTKIDVYSFYSASVYSAEAVDDMTGTGGLEPRFAFNYVIRSQTSAYNLINKICSSMRALAFYSAGTIQLSQDRPSDPVYLFNLSNVTEAGFNYTNTSQTTKYTRINVSYFNMDTQEPDFVSVDDTSLQNKYGVVIKNIKAHGCTSFGQARRFGKWFLTTQNTECEIVNFTTTIAAGVIVRPSMIISIADPLKAGVRRGGRISAVNSTTEIVVDDSNNTDLVTSGSATLSVVMPDGTMETKTISSISGTTITVSSAFSTAPNPNSVWLIENSTVSAQTFRVLSVSESKGNLYSISAVTHNSNKYSLVEDGTSVAPKTTSVLNQILEAPANLNAVESIVEINGKAVSKIDFTFSTVNNAKNYFIQYRKENDNFITINSQSTSIEILNSVKTKYEFRVSSVNVLGEVSPQPAELTFEAVGKTEPPEDITNLTAQPIDDTSLKLLFDPSQSIDVIHGGTIVVKHSSDSSGNASFADSTILVNEVSGNVSEVIVPNLEGEYFVKFKDDTGHLSSNEASVIVSKPISQPKLGIQTRREDTDSPPFQGNKVDTFYDSSLDRLLLSGSLEFDTVTDVDALSNFDFSGPISLTGIYDFASILDLNAIFTLDLEKHFKAFGILPNDLFDTRTANVDTWTDFDGSKAEDCDAQLFVSTSDSAASTSVSATYSQTGKTITITKSSHGLAVGDRLNITFSSGTATNGSFTILTVPDANSFTVAAPQEIAKYDGIGSPAELEIETVKTHPNVGTTLDITILTGLAKSGTYDVSAKDVSGSFIAQSDPAILNAPLTLHSGTLSYIDSTTSTSGNCSYGAKFSQFNKFSNGTFKGRSFQFRSILTSNDPAQNIAIEELGYSAFFKPRTENSIENTGATNGVFSSGTNTLTVQFQHPFFAGTTELGGSTSKYLPSVGITIQNAQSGDFFTVHTITGTSFQIDVKNNGSFVDRNFTYIASGFGKGG